MGSKWLDVATRFGMKLRPRNLVRSTSLLNAALFKDTIRTFL